MTEVSRTFTCFGGATTVAVDGAGPEGEPEQAVQRSVDLLLDLHAIFSRFKPESELSALNNDPRETVPVSELMARFVQAGIDAAAATGGLVDFTLLKEIEAAGYKEDRFRGTLSLPLALALGPAREPGGSEKTGRWKQVQVDLEANTVTRPLGIRFDGGGIVKGMAGDIVADRLAGHPGFAVDCEGDVRVGGTDGAARMLEVPNPFGGPVLHEFPVEAGALATSSIAKRSWFQSMKPTHHLLNPQTGGSAFTGVVQASALAPTALEGESLAKAAVLSGPEKAESWLRYGGVILFDDGSTRVVAPAQAETNSKDSSGRP